MTNAYEVSRDLVAASIEEVAWGFEQRGEHVDIAGVLEAHDVWAEFVATPSNDARWGAYELHDHRIGVAWFEHPASAWMSCWGTYQALQHELLHVATTTALGWVPKKPDDAHAVPNVFLSWCKHNDSRDCIEIELADRLQAICRQKEPNEST